MKCCDRTAGMLRTPCAFERPVRSADGIGGRGPVTYAAVAGAAGRCHFRALSGSERWQAQRVEATTRNRIVCRYFPGLVESDTVVIAARRYNIRFINNVEMRGRWLEIDIDGGVAP